MFGRADLRLAKPTERPYATILLCTPDFPFVQDGARRDTEFKSMQHKMYRDVLGRQQIAYTALAGSLEQRLQHAFTILT